MIGIVIQTGDVAVLLTAGFQEDLAVFVIQFFQGLQAIGAEGRAENGNILDALSRQCSQRGIGIGLEPFRLAEA